MGVHTKIDTSETHFNQSDEKCAEVCDELNRKRIESLLLLEAQVRKCTSLRQLQFLIANETVKLIPSRQTILLHGEKKLSITAISSLATLDKTSPTLRWLQETLNDLPEPVEDDTLGNSIDNKAGFNTLKSTSAPGNNWPFTRVLQVKLPLNSNVGVGKLVFLSEAKFEDADLAMAQRLADTYAHAWNALVRSRISLTKLITRKTSVAIAILLFAALFFPVRMSVLAPVEIIAREPIIIAAPITGVIGSVAVDPNNPVSKGDLLFSFISTDLDNEVKIAQQIVHVAKSKFLRASQDAFGAGLGRRDMAELSSEMNLAIAKLDYAKSRLEKSRIRANGDGVVLFSDKEDWIGKPVSTGEKIMRIANPQHIEYLINLPIADSIILEDGDDVKIFLDVDPLNPVSAKIVRRSYQARYDEMNIFSFELIARSLDDKKARANIANRIGVRGTSQIYGKKTALGFYLFRKPISALRQFVGL